MIDLPSTDERTHEEEENDSAERIDDIDPFEFKREDEPIIFCEYDDDDPQRQQGDRDAQEGGDERVDEVAVQNHRADFPFLISHHFQQGDDVIVLLDRQRRQDEQDAESDEGRPANQDVHHEIHILIDRFGLIDQPLT